MKQRSILLLAVCALLAGCYDRPVDATRDNANSVSLRPGDDVQAVVDSNPEGITFILEPGIYRLQSVEPKNNQRFVGKSGVVFNGAMILDGWKRENEYWVVGGLPKQLYNSGKCLDRTDTCTYREDMFVDGKFYQRVASISDLRRGRAYFDDGKAYLAEDPAGRQIELSIVPAAFHGSAEGVVLENLTVEKYASQAQHGAIDGSDGQNWKLINVSAKWNHGGGLMIGDGMIVEGGSYNHNGQIGIKGTGDGVTIVSVEIAHNNFAGFSAGWEAGGTKFVRTNDLIVRNSCVHHNLGPGLWTDIDNVNTLFEDNTVFANLGDGIKHEISYKAMIRGNRVGQNGKAKDNWLWGSQILIQNSSNVEVVDNIVQVGADGGNAISMIYQNRGTGNLGKRVTTQNLVHQNSVVFLGRRGVAGMIADYEKETFIADTTNRFEKNEYFVKDVDVEHWVYKNRARDWPKLKEIGGEVGSRVEVGANSTIRLSCNG